MAIGADLLALKRIVSAAAVTTLAEPFTAATCTTVAVTYAA